MCRWSEHSWFPLKDYSIQDIQSIKYSVLGLGGIKHPAEADLF